MGRTFDRRWLVGASGALVLFGCGGTPEDILPGERVPVLQREAALAVGGTQTVPVVPDATANPSWPQAGGDADHVLGNLALSGLERAWTVQVGRGSGSTSRLLTTPVIADGRVYVVDAAAELVALDARTGRDIWRVLVAPAGERSEPLGGGVAYEDGRLYVTNGYRQVYAIDPSTGRVLWERTLDGPTRAAPTVAGGRVFVLTANNELTVLASGDGAVLWDHRGFEESTGILGQASPAVAGGVAVVPYSSGEIYALRVENGSVAWQDSLTGSNRMDAVAALADVRGHPIVLNDRVIASSNSGRMVAIDLRSGGRAWEQPTGGIATPWAAGDHVYAITRDAQLVAINIRSGQAAWTVQLDRYENVKDKEDLIVWAGPVMGGGRLLVANSRGQLLAFSPTDGSVLAERSLPSRALLTPVIADGTLYVLTDDGQLTAFR